MLTKTVPYTNFDKKPKNATLYFNVSKLHFAESMLLITQFEDIVKSFEGEERELTPTEITEMIRLVKAVMEMAYGIKSADGEYFDQSPALWQKFITSAVYAEFMFSLFQNPTEMYAFMLGVMPEAFQSEADIEARRSAPEVFAQLDAESARIREVAVDSAIDAFKEPTNAELTQITDDRPLWERENRSPTEDEIRKLSPAEIASALSRRNVS